MGVLGKDLLDFHRPRTNTKVEFGASGYWVESNPAMQPYGAVLTEILKLDAAPFQELLDQYRKAVAENNAEQAARAFQAVANGFASLPLYRLYWDDVQLFASMDVSELFVGEAQEAFREYAMQDDTSSSRSPAIRCSISTTFPPSTRIRRKSTFCRFFSVRWMPVISP